jgi:hypothetical protein
VYTPDELGVDDPDADVAPVAEQPEAGEPAQAEAAAGDQEDAEIVAERLRALTDAAHECAVPTDTVVELCRFYYDQPDLAALTAVHAAEMADRLRYAKRVGVDGAKLARLAARGLAMDDRAKAAQAADVWLTTRPTAADAAGR